MKNTKKRTRETYLSRIMIARIMFYVNTALWLVMGSISVWKMLEDQNDWTAALVAFFFLFAAFTLFVGARIVDQRGRPIFIIILCITGLNILLTFFGYPDFTYIIATLFDFIILGNIIPLKSYYDQT
ncbi:MAG: hypothetical protein JNK32_10790 [Anaerolineales bacterium]|nr:hypothetical protein [Anaerolineales bacterium]